MTELSGTLDGLGLSAIVRFLSGLHKNGTLRLAEDDWSGELYFEAGKLANATLGTRTGLSALDALVELLPRASFTFDSNAVAPGPPTIDLDQAALLAHLDEVAARIARGERTLPAADAVPVQAPTDNEVEEPVQLDRGSLQTLMLVDGQRDVREIVARRGSFDALWQLSRLLDHGLIRIGPKLPAPVVAVPPRAPQKAALARAAIAPAAAPPTVLEPAAVPTPVTAPVTPVAASSDEPAAQTASHCPKLGFEDDPSSSFGRPTRLHRCFALVGKPLPLSLDQQRELCLGEQHATCPRLLAATTNPPARAPRPTPANSDAAAPDEPRIMRLPFASRPTSPERDVASAAAPGAVDRRAPAAPEPRRLRPVTRFGRDAASGPAPDARADQSTAVTNPTPLRARLRGGAPSAAVATPPDAQERPAVPEPAPIPPRREPPLEDASPRAKDGSASIAVPLLERRLGRVPLIAFPAILVAVLVLGAIALLAPQLGTALNDNTDEQALPNTRLVEAGTPVANLARTGQTPVPAQATAGAATAADQPTPDTNAAVAPTADAPLAANPTAASLAQPTAAVAQQPTAATDGALFDERFTSNAAGWPSSATGAALVGNGDYRIVPRQAGQFAAVGAPIANVPNDVVVSATFQKVAGPQGGGYGIIVRDQDTSVRDGTRQDGQYYVLEVGDKGEVGIWRRDTDHWVDLLPWQHSDAVKPGTATNEVVVRAVGNTLTLSVNGTSVATRTDDTFASGRAGLFVGGDGNQVAVSHFAIQAP